MRVTVLGGAGFLGTNLVLGLRDAGHDAVAVDNLSRPGSEINAALIGPVIEADICDPLDWLPPCDVVVNLAGQTTVTGSIGDPVSDARVNVMGHLNVLEWARENGAAVLFSSTNKVYGEVPGGLIPELLVPSPVGEETALDLASPYGCSKGAADQYTIDYARTFGLRTLVFRQSCVYGEHQWGMEGQGWISWFARQLLLGEPITVFGDGDQVRDILHADDWTRLALHAIDYAGAWDGHVVNIGGGRENAISVNDAIRKLASIIGVEPSLVYEPRRPSDQAWYVSRLEGVRLLYGWEPEIGIEDGLRRLVKWTEHSISTQSRSAKSIHGF